MRGFKQEVARAGGALAMLACTAGAVHALSIEVGSATGAPGARANFRVTVSTAGEQVAGAISEVIWDPHVPIAAKPDGTPDCQFSNLFDPQVSSTLSVLEFQPGQCPGGSECPCVPGQDCVKVRAINLQNAGQEPIAVRDGTLLYSCNVAIPFDAPQGNYPLTCSDPQLSNPKAVAFDGAHYVCTGDGMTGCATDIDCGARVCLGNPNTSCTQDADCAAAGGSCLPAAGGQCTMLLPLATCTNGQIVVSGPPLPTPTATPGAGGGGGGCQTTRNTSVGWVGLALVLPVVVVRLRARCGKP